MNKDSKSKIIAELKKVIGELSKGDLSTRFTLQKYDKEFTPLINQFNSLIEKINEQFLAIKLSGSKINEDENWTLALFKKNPQPMWVYDIKQLNFLAVNEAAVSKYGYTQKEFMSMKITDINATQPNIKSSKSTRNSETLSYQKQKLKDNSIVYVQLISHSLNYNGVEAELVLAYDVTDKKKYEDALKTSEERQKLALEGADLATWDWNILTGEIKFNDHWAEMLGYKASELKPTFDTWKNMVHPDDYEKVIATLTKHLSAETPSFQSEYRLKHKSGKLIWILDKGRVLDFTEEGKPLRACGTHLEITDKKNAEELIRQNELRFSTLINQAGDAFFLCDVSNWKIIEVNDYSCSILGYSRNELLNMNIRDIDGRFNENLNAYADETISISKTPLTVESILRRKNGSFFPVEIRISILEFNSKNYSMALARDISSRKKIEQDLLLSQFSIENAPEAIYWIKEDASIVYVNEASCKSLGYTKEEFSKLTVFDFDPSLPREKWAQHWDKTRKLGSYSIETLHKRKDGYVFPVEISISFLTFADQEYHCAFARDVTERRQSDEALKLSESLLKKSQQIARIGHYTLNVDTGYWSSSATLDEIFGIDDNFVKNTEGWLTIIHPDDKETMNKYLSGTVIGNKTAFNREYRIIRFNDKAVRWVHGLGELVFDDFGNVKYMIGTIQDINSRKEADIALRISEARLSEAQRVANIGNWDRDVKNNKLFLSDEVYRIYGLERNEVGEHFELFNELIHPEDKELVTNSINDARYKYKPYSIKHRIVLPDGRIKHVNNRGEIELNESGKLVRMFGTVQDINELKLAEEKLIKLINEKDILLRELYHRTKNNMQVIRSILALQASYTNNGEAIKMLNETENRILAMSLVHEKLYQSNNLSSIDMKEYITDLINLLLKSYRGLLNRVNVVLELESIEMLLDSAIPCGLIINELLSNSMKHAFPDNRVGEILLKLSKNIEGEIDLFFSDNGVGVPDNFDFRNQPTLGLQSIFTIAEQQLFGNVSMQNKNGVSFQMVFKNTLYSKRV